MAVDTSRLIKISTLKQFKTRQDAYNDLRFLKRSNVAMDGNEIAITKTEAATGVDAVVLKALTSGSVLDATKLTGTVPMGCMPAGALERLVVVADDTARFALTTSDVQLGDVVKVTSTGKMYFVKDVDELDNENGYEVFVAGEAAAVAWNNVTGKPSFGTSAGDFAEGNHVHGNVTNDGKIGSTANLPIITGANGVLQAGSFGTSANTFAEGNHVHGNVTNDGKIGSTANLPIITGANGVLQAGSFGTSANTFAEGNHTHGNISNDGKVGTTADLPLITSTGGAVAAGNWATGANVESATAYVNGADTRLTNNRLMTGYTIGTASSNIATTDTLNQAIGKLEYKANNLATNEDIDEEIFGIAA